MKSKKLKRELMTLLLTAIITLPLALPMKAFAAETTPPKIIGLSAITIDVQTGEVLYALDIDKQMYPASTTKLLTGLLLAENKAATDVLTYTQNAKNQPTYSINTDQHPLNVGQQFTADSAMKAMLISSANDMAAMVADAVGGSQQGFAKLMNDKVTQLQTKYPYMKNSHFVTPNGIDNNITDHLTSAYDLSVIGREAFKNKWVADTLKTEKVYFETLDGKIKIQAETRNKFIETKNTNYDKTNIGGKTGYTAKANRCLVTMFERDGRKILGVVMKSAYDDLDQSVFSDMKKIIDYSYSIKPVTIKKKSDLIETKTLTYKLFKFFGPTKSIDVPIIIDSDVIYYENDQNKKELKTESKIDNLDPWKLETTKVVGTFNRTEREVNKSYKLFPTVSTKDIVKANTPIYITVAIVSIIVLIALILGIFILIMKISKGKPQKRLYR